MKQFFVMLLTLAMILSLTACGRDNADDGTPSNGSVAQGDQQILTDGGDMPQVQEDDDPPAIPDPARILDDAEVDLTEGVELSDDNGTYVFDRYTYDFQVSGYGDKSEFLAYDMLLQNVGMDLVLSDSTGLQSGYFIVWDEYWVGYLFIDGGTWELYVSPSIGLDS